MPRRDPKADWRRALDLLAASPDGCTEAIMLAHGITADVIVDLVHAGLAAATCERVALGPNTIEVVRVRITPEGRRVLAED
jgi:hypothetical protein